VHELTTKRKGDIAELYVASLLLSDPSLEVFTSACDDGHGSDLAIRSARTGRWYAVQVKATGPTVNPWIPEKRFRDADDFLLAAVVLDPFGIPASAYLVPASAWKTDASGCLGQNSNGGANGPYFEVRTTARRHAESLAKYRIQHVMTSL
jgi:hypothetical protein